MAGQSNVRGTAGSVAGYDKYRHPPIQRASGLPSGTVSLPTLLLESREVISLDVVLVSIPLRDCKMEPHHEDKGI